MVTYLTEKVAGNKTEKNLKCLNDKYFDQRPVCTTVSILIGKKFITNFMLRKNNNYDFAIFFLTKSVFLHFNKNVIFYYFSKQEATF